MAIAKKRLKFFDVEIPLIKKTTHLYAYTLQETEGRIIKYDMTRILKGKSSLLSARVKLEGDKARAFPTKFELITNFIRKIVRKGTDYVEDSFLSKSKDSVIRIKPLLITRRKVPKKIRKALKEKTKEELINYLKDRKTEEIFDDILKNKLQKNLSLKLKKTYPLSSFEIRYIKAYEKEDKKR